MEMSVNDMVGMCLLVSLGGGCRSAIWSLHDAYVFIYFVLISATHRIHHKLLTCHETNKIQLSLCNVEFTMQLVTIYFEVVV